MPGKLSTRVVVVAIAISNEADGKELNKPPKFF